MVYNCDRNEITDYGYFFQRIEIRIGNLLMCRDTGEGLLQVRALPRVLIERAFKTTSSDGTDLFGFVVSYACSNTRFLIGINKQL